MTAWSLQLWRSGGLTPSSRSCAQACSPSTCLCGASPSSLPRSARPPVPAPRAAGAALVLRAWNAQSSACGLLVSNNEVNAAACILHCPQVQAGVHDCRLPHAIDTVCCGSRQRRHSCSSSLPRYAARYRQPGAHAYGATHLHPSSALLGRQAACKAGCSARQAPLVNACPAGAADNIIHIRLAHAHCYALQSCLRADGWTGLIVLYHPPRADFLRCLLPAATYCGA